jgi:hypothetical protein
LRDLFAVEDSDYAGDNVKLRYTEYGLYPSNIGFVLLPSDQQKLESFEFLRLHSNAYFISDEKFHLYSSCFTKCLSYGLSMNYLISELIKIFLFNLIFLNLRFTSEDKRNSRPAVFVAYD